MFDVDEEKVNEILANDPKAQLAEGEEGEIFVFHPTRGHFLRFEDGAAAGKAGFAQENFLLDAVLYPDKVELKKWMNENRGAVPALATLVHETFGGGKKFQLKPRGAGA